MKFRSKVLMLLGKVREQRGSSDVNSRATLNTLKDAKDNQTRLVKRALLESHGIFFNAFLLVLLFMIIGFVNTISTGLAIFFI